MLVYYLFSALWAFRLLYSDNSSDRVAPEGVLAVTHLIVVVVVISHHLAWLGLGSPFTQQAVRVIDGILYSVNNNNDKPSKLMISI